MMLSPPVQKQRVTVSLSVPLIERLRNAVYWTEPISLVKLFTEALEEIVAKMERGQRRGLPPTYIPPQARATTRTLRSGPLHSNPFS